MKKQKDWGTEHNGYSNYITWAVCLYIDNEYPLYQAKMKRIKEKIVRKSSFSAGSIKTFVKWLTSGTYCPDLQEVKKEVWYKDGTPADRIGFRLSDINWQEIANDWKQEGEELVSFHARLAEEKSKRELPILSRAEMQLKKLLQPGTIVYYSCIHHGTNGNRDYLFYVIKNNKPVRITAYVCSFLKEARSKRFGYKTRSGADEVVYAVSCKLFDRPRVKGAGHKLKVEEL